MLQLKNEGLRQCQITTLFKTTNKNNKYRSGKWIDLTVQNPIFLMWNNKPTRSDYEFHEENYQTYVIAPIIGYSIAYY